MSTTKKALLRFSLIMLIVSVFCQTTVFASDAQAAGGLSGPAIAGIAAAGVVLIGGIIAVIVALVRKNRDN